MKTINKIEIVIVLKPGIIRDQSKAERGTVEILAENERFLCLNDHYFTKISTKNSIAYTNINKPSVSFYINDSCFGTQIRYINYSYTHKRAATVRKEIEQAIAEKFGPFQSVDLSLIDNL